MNRGWVRTAPAHSNVAHTEITVKLMLFITPSFFYLETLASASTDA
jgi:hypothetical protein